MRTLLILIIALSLSACQSGQSKERSDYSSRRDSSLFQIANGEYQNTSVKRFKSSESVSLKRSQSNSVNLSKTKRSLDVTPIDRSSYTYVGQSRYKNLEKKEAPVDHLPKIKNAPTLSKRDIQYLLKKLGYYNGKLDGVIGKKSIAAIKAFQSDAKLETDGIPGRKTKTQLVTHVKTKLKMDYQSALSTN